MADENTLRSYRSNDPYARDAGQTDAHDAAPATDPLAELARLIGQNDPFADGGRAHSEHALPHTAESVPLAQDAPADDWRRYVQRPDYATRHDEPSELHGAAEPDDPPAMPHGYHHEFRHDAGPLDTDREFRAVESPSFHDDRVERHGRDKDRYLDDGRIDSIAAPGIAPLHYGDADYDDPPGRQTHERDGHGGWLRLAAMVACCCLVGVTAAFGYRSFLKPSSHGKAAPVIVADNSPAKIVPATPERKQSRSQDRFGGQDGSERLVSREEQPVALPSSQGPSRIVLATPPAEPAEAPVAAPPASAPTPFPPPPVPVAAPPPPAAAGTGGSNAPKRVRTLAIRPGAEEGNPGGSHRAARPVPSPRTTSTVTSPQHTAAAGAPLSLDPGAQASEPARPQAAPRAARDAWTPAPRESRGGGPKLASAPSNDHAAGGGYVVQVSSQRSEADARASFRGLQAKYSQLKSRRPLIRRVDLGSKGTFYRAMVGPFGSAHDADRFCGGLKKSGGQCVILRN